MPRHNALTLFLGIFVLFQACLRPPSPAGPPEPPPDELQELAGMVADARAGEPLARAACSLLPLDPDDPEPGRRRRYCHGTLDAVEAQLVTAESLLRSAEACRAAQDAACLAEACGTARQIRGTLDRLRQVWP